MAAAEPVAEALGQRQKAGGAALGSAARGSCGRAGPGLRWVVSLLQALTATLPWLPASLPDPVRSP